MENDEANKQEIIDKKADDIIRVLTNYENAKERNMQGQDKVIMAISSALLGLLPTIFNKKLLETIQVPNVLLKALIISNAITIIFVLISYYTANKSMDIKKQNALDGICRTNCWACITKFLNFGYLLATCITIITLATIMWQIF